MALPLVSDGAAHEILKDIRVVYTDIDGTFLAPGGLLLKNGSKEPSLDLARIILELAEAGIDVVPVTGRSRYSVSEISRLLGFNTFIGEMGSVTQRGIGYSAEVTYNTGDWDYAPSLHRKPFDAIDATGITRQLMSTFPGKLERNLPWAEGREVTHVFRGSVNILHAQALIDANGLPFVFRDNGQIHPPKHDLEVDDEIHVYHLMPRGVDKGTAVAADIQHRRIDVSQAISVGDSVSDAAMGDHTAAFIIMQNASPHESLMRQLEALSVPVFSTSQPTSSGWVELGRALLDSR